MRIHLLFPVLLFLLSTVNAIQRLAGFPGSIRYRLICSGMLLLIAAMAFSQPVITLTAQPGRCPSSGSITVNATGTVGTPLYSIKKTTDAEYSIEQTSNVFNNLISATYTISVHDASGVTISNPVTLTNAPYSIMSISSLVSGNMLVTACNPDGSIELTMTGGRSPFTYRLRNGPTIKPAVVDTPGTRVRFVQLESGDYFIDITDSCGNILTQSSAIVVRSLYNLKDTILGSVDGMSGPLQYGGNCVDSLSFSTNNILLRSVNGTVLFQRDIKHMPSGYPMQARVLYPNGTVTDTSAWQSVFSKFPLPNYSPDSSRNKYQVQLRHPCNDTNIVTSPVYTIPFPYQTRSGFCVPSLVRTTAGYNCGTVNIHLVDISNSSNVRDYTWDGNSSSFTFNTADWGTAKFYVFITIGSNTYQTANVTAGNLATVNIATDSWDFTSSTYCDFSTGRIRSYSGSLVNNTVPITYSILSGPVIRDPVTSTEALPVFIWDTLPRGTYVLKVDYGGCRSDTLIRKIAPPYTGFAADSLSYRLGASCGKYVITGKGWYVDTLGVPVTDTLSENDTLLGLSPGLRQYTARFLNPNGTFGPTSLNTYSTQPFAITGAGEVGPGTYRIVFMSANHSENHCYYVERSITIPPYVPVDVDVSSSGGVACDSLTGDVYVGTTGGNIYIATNGNSVRPFSFRIKPKDSTDTYYTSWQTSPLFENQPVGVYTAQVYDSCGYTATANIELVGIDTVSNINVTSTTFNGNGSTGSVCQYDSVAFELRVLGPSSDVRWVLPTGTDTINSSVYSINNFTATDAGKYYVLYNSGGCTRKDSVTLNFILAPTFTAGTASICAGASVDLATTLSNLSPNSAFSFYSDSTVQVQLLNNVVSPDSTISYYVQSTDNTTGCRSLVNTVPIVVNYRPHIGAIVAPPPGCEGQTLMLTSPIVTTEGSPVTNEGWMLDGLAFNPATLVTLADNGKQLRYLVQSACGDSTTAAVPVTVNAQPNFSFDSPDTLRSSTTFDLTTLALASGDTTGLTLTYFDSLYAPLSGAEVTDAGEGVYYVVGTVSAGCADTSMVEIVVEESTLPVGLTQFNAGISGNDVILSWTTAFEQNSNRFEIEQSIDGIRFSSIGLVRSAGNSGIDINYVFTDANISRYHSNIIFYRLKQVDNDGHFVYSQVRVVRVNNSSNMLKAYPVPFNSLLIVDLPKEMKGSLVIKILDINGKVVYMRQERISNTQTNLVLTDLSHLARGSYLLTISGDKGIRNIGILKQ